MAEYMHLVGAEGVSHAASTMSSAASDMRSAASSIQDAFFQHQQFLNDWLTRLEAALENLAS